MTVQSVGRTILLLCNDDIKRSFAPMRREKSKVRTAGALGSFALRLTKTASAVKKNAANLGVLNLRVWTRKLT